LRRCQWAVVSGLRLGESRRCAPFDPNFEYEKENDYEYEDDYEQENEQEKDVLLILLLILVLHFLLILFLMLVLAMVVVRGEMTTGYATPAAARVCRFRICSRCA
jgi:hypothetical protein